jgi:hypothetical protein
VRSSVSVSGIGRPDRYLGAVKRWIAVFSLVVLSVLGMPPVAAQADEADCAESPYLDGGFETFDLDPRFLPPSMQRSGWDCALRVEGRTFDETLLPDGRYATSINFMLFYVDMSFDEMVAFFRAFEASGYMGDDDINLIDDGAGGTISSALGVDDLVAADPRPGYVNARFSHPADVPPPGSPGSNIYSIVWTDGVEFQSANGVPNRPQLVANIILTEPFVDGTDLDDPSVLSGLPTIYLPSGVQWTFIGAGSLMLMLVVGWPSTLLNSVVGSRYQAFVHWLSTRFRRKAKDEPDAAPAPAPAAAPATIKRSGLPGWLMWPGFALAAILGAFVDPDFGLNLMSLRLVVTLFLSFVLFNLLTWTIVRRVAVRLQPESDPYLRFRWGSLVLVIVAVLVARLLGLEPGVIFGLVAGIAYATSLQAAKSAVVTIVGSAVGLGFALIAWIGYSLLAPLETGNFVVVFLVEFLAGVTVKGVSTLPLSLLPLGNLDGAKLFGWKRLVWAASYVVGLAAFMIVLLTIPKAWGEIPGDFVRWLILFGVYAVVAIVIWAVNARMLKKKPLPPEAQQGDQPDAITID